ncbi:MAG: Urease accessory protein ureF 1 [Aquabacterium sp.]|nr:MAG: Urease accessory protein ureF 1 [Aquabacterium sp.]
MTSPADARPSAAPAGEAASLLGVLQLADSFFPSGATAFSWGLESLKLDGRVRGAEQVFELLRDQIGQRWAGFDRPLMHAACRAPRDAGALQAVRRLDRLCEAMTLSHGLREAGRRLGFTQLRIHAELGSELAAGYLEDVRAGRATGHLPVMQGLLWTAGGFTPAQCDAMAASGLCTAIVGAAIRLGLIGHLDAQRLLLRARPLVEQVVRGDPPAIEDLWGGTPALDVAAMRHEARTARLFAS